MNVSGFAQILEFRFCGDPNSFQVFARNPWKTSSLFFANLVVFLLLCNSELMPIERFKFHTPYSSCLSAFEGGVLQIESNGQLFC